MKGRHSVPTADLEHRLEANGYRDVAGIDEAGRGPLAGPVCAAAVRLRTCRVPSGLNDSKVLRRSERNRLFDELARCASIAVGWASVEEIDRLNILAATMLAMRRAAHGLAHIVDYFLVDGNQLPSGLPAPAEAITAGDRRSLSVAAASIVAKVSRDRVMTRLAVQFPHYGWERNSGYGTPQHRKALQEIGVSPHHRRSFAPVRALASVEGR